MILFLFEVRGFLFIYTRHINPLNLRTQYKKKRKKTLQLIHLTMLFIFMMPFFAVVVFVLIIKET